MTIKLLDHFAGDLKIPTTFVLKLEVVLTLVIDFSISLDMLLLYLVFIDATLENIHLIMLLLMGKTRHVVAYCANSLRCLLPSERANCPIPDQNSRVSLGIPFGKVSDSNAQLTCKIFPY